MKGQVKIILKSPNGDVVKEIEQTNRVFDVSKQVMKEIFPLTVQNNVRYNTDMSNSSSYSINVLHNIFSTVDNIRDWFRSIKINDEFFEEDGEGHIVDSAMKDWKIPQLYGSDNTTITQTNNKRYTYINGNYSKQTNSIKKVYYSWTDCPAFTMRSINLCHYDAVGRNPGQINQVVNYNGRSYPTITCWKYGNFYFGYVPRVTSKANSSYNAATYYSYLAKNPYFHWSNNGFRYVNHLAVMKDYSEENAYKKAIWPLPKNEIALLRFYQDVTTDAMNNDASNMAFDNCVRYVTIIDNQTGDIKRQFHIGQFQDSGASTNTSTYYWPYRYPYSYCFSIVSTENRNFLIQYSSFGYLGSTKTSRYRIWEIPNTQEGYDITVACVAVKSTDTSVVEGKEYYTRAYSNQNKPGELIDYDGYKYTLVANPTGSPKTNNYYEVSTRGVDGTPIPYIDVPEITTLNYDIAYCSIITNHFMCSNNILTFNDNDGSISVITRYINNCANSSNTVSYDAQYFGKTNIPGLQYGVGNSDINFPIWYNTSCMNLSEPIDIPAGYTLTVEYTITAN